MTEYYVIKVIPAFRLIEVFDKKVVDKICPKKES